MESKHSLHFSIFFFDCLILGGKYDFSATKTFTTQSNHNTYHIFSASKNETLDIFSRRKFYTQDSFSILTQEKCCGFRIFLMPFNRFHVLKTFKCTKKDVPNFCQNKNTLFLHTLDRKLPFSFSWISSVNLLLAVLIYIFFACAEKRKLAEKELTKCFHDSKQANQANG